MPNLSYYYFTVSFKQAILPGVTYAVGYRDDGVTQIQDGHLSFPPLAAGGMGTPRGLAKILLHIAIAYNDKDGSGPISHETATLMLDNVVDKGALEFMRSYVGYGVFIAHVGLCFYKSQIILITLLLQ